MTSRQPMLPVKYPAVVIDLHSNKLQRIILDDQIHAQFMYLLPMANFVTVASYMYKDHGFEYSFQFLGQLLRLRIQIIPLKLKIGTMIQFMSIITRNCTIWIDMNVIKVMK